MVVVGKNLDLPAADAAVGVDVVGRQLGRLGDRGAGDGRLLADHADADRLIGERGAGQPEHRRTGQRQP